MSARIVRVFATICDDYMPAELQPDDETRLRRVQDLVNEVACRAGELWDEENRGHRPDGLHGASAVEAARSAYATAEDAVIESVLIGGLPDRAVHEVRHSRIYAAPALGKAKPATFESGSVGHWYERAASAGVAIEPVGDPNGYASTVPIEDVALAPRVEWTEADYKQALEKAIDIYGLQPGQWMDMEWPPTASLYYPGSVCPGEFEPCPAHFDSEDEADWDECPDCQSSLDEVVDEPALWRWLTALQVYEIECDIGGELRDHPIFHDPLFEVATSEQDPREVLIGPPWRWWLWG